MATSEILKNAVHRPRPREVEAGETRGKSFPSGHTTIAMAPSFFIAKRYGWLQAAPSLAIATFVGYSRVQANAHYITDVAGATLMSFLFANFLTFERKIGDVHVSLVPPSGGAQYGIGVQFTW